MAGVGNIKIFSRLAVAGVDAEFLGILGGKLGEGVTDRVCVFFGQAL